LCAEDKPVQDEETTAQSKQVVPADDEEEDQIALVSLVFALNKISECLYI
jgi:hypothetical protein